MSRRTAADKAGDVRVMVTGAAGFIGFHLCRSLLKRGYSVVGLDNLNPYYDVTLKTDRLRNIGGNGRFSFMKTDLAEREAVADIFSRGRFDMVVNLAAQAGVRYSLENPHAYVESNVVGFINVLEGCRTTGVRHLVFASSSSVYGANRKMPFSERDGVDHPMSLYAATKKSGELLAHSYSSLYGLPCTGLRFFTVYGPWGRPDMALFLFTRAILEDRPIEVFNYGRMRRDFTYISDIVEGITRVLERPPEPDRQWDGGSPDASTSYAPYRLFNIGDRRPVDLLHFIGLLEESLGKKARKIFLPLQAGDVPETHADVDRLITETGFAPAVGVEDGIRRFVAWYRWYYRV